MQEGLSITKLMRDLFDAVAIRLFVDSVWLHRFWGCHRIPERCFFIRGRQFHVCARCTGLITGLPSSVLLLPLYEFAPALFCFFASALITDGLTQFLEWRTSNNALRFLTGFGTAITLLPSIIALIGYYR